MVQSIERKNELRSLFRFRLLVVAAVLFLVVASPALAGFTYLPEPNSLPKTIHEIQSSCPDTDKVESYEDQGVKAYIANVFCPCACCPGCPSCTMGGKKIGTLDFEYSPFKGDLGGVSKGAGGALIRGGFKLADGLALCPDYTIRWLQYYKSTGYINEEKIDGSPLYPNHTIAGVTAALFDAPVDQFSKGAIKLEFESALVCWKPGTKTICYIGSLWWGYENKVAPTNSVTGIYPWGWTPGLTPEFKAQFASEYSDWTLQEGCCIIPEPGALILGSIGVGLVGWFRRRRTL